MLHRRMIAGRLLFVSFQKNVSHGKSRKKTNTFHFQQSIRSSILFQHKFLSSQQTVKVGSWIFDFLYITFCLWIRNNFQQIYYHSSFVYVRYLIQHFLKQLFCDYDDLKFSLSKFITNWFWLMDWLVESDGWVIIAFSAVSDRHNRSKY